MTIVLRWIHCIYAELFYQLLQKKCFFLIDKWNKTHFPRIWYLFKLDNKLRPMWDHEDNIARGMMAPSSVSGL